MKTIAIVYSSKYGHTKQYADWLKEDVDADAIDIGKFNITQMLAYKLVIFACGVYGDKLSIMDFVKKNVTAIPTQKTMIMAVGWYTNDSKEAKEKLINDNYPPEFKGKVPMYVVNSGIDKKQISKMDSVKLVAAKLAIEKKDGRSNDDINALGILNGYSDYTSKDNLENLKKGIDEFLNPPQPAPEPKAAPAAKTAPAKAAPASASKPAAKPASEADALADSVEEAFKHLGAKPVIRNPEPPKPEPKAEVPAPAPAAEEQHAEPVIKFNANGKVVVSSVLDAINSLNGTPQQSAPKPEPMVVEAVKPAPVAEPKPEPVAEVKPAPVAEPKPEPVAEVKPAPVAEPKPEPVAEVKPAPVAEPKPEPVAEVKPAPVAEPKPEPVAEVKPEPAPEPAKKTNSYMELFAKRRRASAEEAPKAEEPVVSAPVQQAAEPVAEISVPQPEPVPAPAPAIPRPGPTPEADLDFGGLDFGAAASTASAPAPAPTPAPQPAPAASNELDLDSYDFIGDSKPSVSSRAMNAVQALAKAKEDAEREAAQKAKELPSDEEITQNNYYNSTEEQGFEMSADDDGGIIVEASAPAEYEEESDGLEAFEFTNDIDYDVEAELDIKFVEPEDIEPVKHESKNDLDIKKLQEEINASIESNRAAKEKMMARYGKKKEEPHNPFAVQFDEDEDKKKKKSKKAAPEPKFLDDPIDPDIFFGKSNKGMDFNTGSMPEIRFKH